MNKNQPSMKLFFAIFYTNDLKKSVEFYRDFIGFEVEYVQEGRFASFKLENTRLGIKQKKEVREIPGAQSIILDVPNVEEVYEAYKAKGANF